jgi:hypothetical protein
MYRAAPSSRLSHADAARVGAFLERTFGDEPRTPADVVRAAKPKRSPIHDDFEWDDAVAAGEHRLWQARHLLNSIQVVYSNGEQSQPTRAFHRVIVTADDEQTAAYVPAEVVWETPDLAAQVVAAAKRELVLWTARYRQYETLASEVAAVDAIAEGIAA